MKYNRIDNNIYIITISLLFDYILITLPNIGDNIDVEVVFFNETINITNFVIPKLVN